MAVKHQQILNHFLHTLINTDIQNNKVIRISGIWNIIYDQAEKNTSTFDTKITYIQKNDNHDSCKWYWVNVDQEAWCCS